MMGVGIVMEGMYTKVSARGVGGWSGWVWTICWVLGWANFLVDAWCRRGLVGSVFMSDSARPARYIISYISGVFP
jgi:hypothetical protein